VSEIKHLQTPLSTDIVESLAVGDLVTISGDIVITAGLPTHHRIIEYIESGKELPVNLNGAVLLQFGGMNREVDGELVVDYMNPTTSTRFNELMPTIIRHTGLRAVGGKGGLDDGCAQTMQETGCVYLSFPGGGATLYSNAIRGVSAVEWNDLIPHYRLIKLQVEKLGPGTVGIDAHGNSIYSSLQKQADERMQSILEYLEESRSR
jgi:fumarate hydratase subunit beta